MNYIEKLYKEYGLEKYYHILYSKTKQKNIKYAKGKINLWKK